MKFGRYLEESQTPEWKKKYINYRLLKKLNKAIQREQNEKAERGTLSSRQDGRASGSVANSVQVNVSPIQTRPRNMRQRSASIMTTHSSMKAQSPGANKSLESQGLANSPENRRHYGTMGRTPPVDGRTPSIRIAARSKVDIPETEGFALPPPAKSFSEHNVPITENAGSRPQLPRTRRASFMAQLPFGRSKQRLGNDTPVVFNAYAEALTSFSPGELRFFEVLEKEVQKVEEFFIQRQREGAVKLAAIKLQFKELVDHRRIYHEYEAMRGKRWSAIPSLTSNVIGDAWQFVRRGNRLNVEDEGDAGTATPQQPSRFDPEDYQSAKKKLKHAIQEHYRYLELLNDFRIINLEAVRKAIKKVEKTTNLRVRDAFYREKIDGLDITDDQLLKSMIKEIEDIYADRFEGGNLKKARARLRMDPLTNKTHHFSTFISGLNLGLAIPAFVSGVYQVLHPNIREEIPEWKPLLVVYSALAIPSMFSLIIGLNLIAWAHARINYVFIFDLDLRSVLDYREYFEIPSFLFMTLCYAFALSFNRVFDVNPAIWPLVWLLLALLTVTIPLRTVHSSSRSWLIRSIGRLLMPGFGPVGFTDFWMGDQFCSLVYSLSSLFFIGCAYSYDLSDWVEDDVHSKCSLSHHWLAGFFLTSLPSVIRLIQCIKRWLDSGLYIHLINGGKYSSSVLTYALYYYWRNTGTKHRGSTFTTWIFFAVVNSIYTTAWDFLMDWSLLQHRALRPMLRRELIYSRTWIYYFALMTNLIGRFTWIIYIPAGNFDYQLRGFIGACVEMLRRIQWNFFRLENEHIGNADQYRVTKEVPLPYKFTNEQVEEDSDEDKDELDNQARSPGRRFSLHRRRPSQGTMPTGPSSDRAGLSPAQIQSSSSPWKEPDQAFSLGGPALPTDTVEEARQIPTSPSISSLRKVSGLIGPPMSPVWGTGLGVVQKPSGLGPVDE